MHGANMKIETFNLNIQYIYIWHTFVLCEVQWGNTKRRSQLWRFSIILVKRSSCPCGPQKLSRYCDSLQDGRSGDRHPVGARFSAPVQTGPGAHPVSYAMGTECLSLWIKWPGGGVDHPPASSAEVKERMELYLHSPLGPSWPVLGWPLPLPFTCFSSPQKPKYVVETK